MIALTAFMVFVFGAVIGSFLNVVILRLPAGESLGGRSHCPHCGHVLGGAELVPLLSFLWLGRRCRKCRTKISWRYFTIELLTGVLFLCFYLVQQPAAVADYLTFVKTLLIAATLIVVFTIDLEHFLILDSVIFTTGFALLVLNIATDVAANAAPFSLRASLAGGLIAAAAASLPFWLLWRYSRGKWMGFGDVKFVAWLGLALGWPLIWVNWLLAFWLGAFFGIILLVLGRKTLQSRLPFGTFLSLAALFALLWGKPLLGWYLALIGF